MQLQPVSDADLDAIAAQLGRKPVGVVGVAATCPAGHPSVVASYPLQRRQGRIEPFPTLYWLTCPELVRAISRLEMAGLIGELDVRLATDAGFASQMRRNHESYIEERWRLIADADRAEIAAAGLSPAFLEKGIGGIRNFASVKCLHLHYAHHLAAQNVVGAILESDHAIAPCR